MSLDTDDEILQDFLVEAGEILEQLNEQLVDLEQRPDDFDLLNAVFRGFHTIKGGAGFLSLTPLVEVTHKSEDVFNLLRQGQCQVTPELMDAVLQVLDVVNAMFRSIQQGEMPEPADPTLIQTLIHFAHPEQVQVKTAPPPVEKPTVVAKKAAVASKPVQTAAAAPAKTPTPPKKAKAASPAAAMISEMMMEEPAAATSDEITEDEFEALLDQLHGEGQFHAGVTAQHEAPEAQSAGATPAGDDEITEEEFEALLDQLHGKGQFHVEAVAHPEGTSASEEQSAPASAESTPDDEITEEEFEALLDQLHGKGKFSPQTLPHADEQPEQPEQPTAAEPVPPPVRTVVSKPVAKAKKSEPTPTPFFEEPAAEPKASGMVRPVAEAKGGAAKQQQAAETTVRVDTARLDDIMNMVGELVLVRNRLATLKATLNDEEVAQAVSNLDVVTSDLQLAVMKTRMQPIKKVFGRFPRVVRDLARSLNKEIDLVLVGEETDLDKNLVEALADPLVHLVRNAVDHGIEPPDERERAGKERKGTVVLSAAQEGDHILLTISDDGKGMDAEVLRRKAVEKGMMDEEAAARLDQKECFNLIFAPGFSTKQEISDVSGRGVGMDVVKTRIAQMNGQVEVISERGRGSTITIKLPLTLAILPTLMVVLGRQSFALPLSSVVEIFNLDLSRTNVVDGRQTIMVRQRALPLFYLRKWLIQDPTLHDQPYKNGEGHVVVVNMGANHIGLVVDHLIGQEEVVIKPLGKMLQGLDGMAGATITGDGRIALILDVPGLMRRYAKKG